MSSKKTKSAPSDSESEDEKSPEVSSSSESDSSSSEEEKTKDSDASASSSSSESEEEVSSSEEGGLKSDVTQKGISKSKTHRRSSSVSPEVRKRNSEISSHDYSPDSSPKAKRKRENMKLPRSPERKNKGKENFERDKGKRHRLSNSPSSNRDRSPREQRLHSSTYVKIKKEKTSDDERLERDRTFKDKNVHKDKYSDRRDNKQRHGSPDDERSSERHRRDYSREQERGKRSQRRDESREQGKDRDRGRHRDDRNTRDSSWDRHRGGRDQREHRDGRDSSRSNVKKERYGKWENNQSEGLRQREREHSHAQEQRRDRERNDQRRRDNRNRGENNPFQSSTDDGGEYGKPDDKKGKDEANAEDKAKPDFGLSGKLTEDTNTFRGVVIKYNEPPEARKPKKRWRLYVFKGSEALPVLHVHRQSAYLMGRDRKVVDVPVDHPSCSKQHAVFQYRLVDFQRPDGTMGRRVRPYIIDLGSTNGTYINNQRVEPQRYYELKEKDVLKFGFSSREYVLLHEKTDTSELHEDDEGTDGDNDSN